MKNNARPQLIIYDLDGTLIDSVHEIYSALNLAIQDTLQLSITLEQVRQWIGNGSLKLVERAMAHFSGHTAPDKSLFERCHQRFLHFYALNLDQPSTLYPYTQELLAFVKTLGIPQAIATNKPQQFVPAILKNIGIEHYFDAIVGGNSLPTKKPDPLPLNYLCQRFHCAPQNALMIGDSSADAGSAFAAQIPCWLLEQGYNQGSDLKQLPSQQVFKDTHELFKYMHTLSF
jgi:phosphoglycolate phosphatase